MQSAEQYGIQQLRATAARSLAFFLVLSTPLTSAGSTDIMGVATVIDGDTIEIHGQHIRLHGVDAPESAQECRRPDGSRWRCGQQAALALQDLISRRPVTCARQDTDRYGRIVAKCSVGGVDINAWLVTNGWAVAYRQYSSDYVGVETTARAGGLGIWSGEFAMPWDWRRDKRSGNRTSAKDNASPKCLIKGNIGSSGDRIYHLPDGRFYDQTGIDESKGERWFCTEAEARAAGWRRSSQ